MYQKAIVTFIDILGFKNLVKQSDADRINNILSKIEKATSPPAPNELFKNVADNAKIVSFSDSIIRVRKIETKKNKKCPTGLLFQELMSLVHAQSELLDYEIVIRGCVSFGDIYISKGRVFGPGLIQAYELESKSALYPRIIIDPKLIQEHKQISSLELIGIVLMMNFKVLVNCLDRAMMECGSLIMLTL